MRSVSRNVLANFGGHFWIVVLNLGLVPLYLPLVGVEAYGLIGFYNALLAVFAIIDNGLGLGATREVALRAGTERAGATGRLIRSLEWIYWPIAVAAGLICASLSPWLAHRWFSPQQISYQTLGACLGLLGVNIAFRFPAGLYTGVLTGLHQQPVLNMIRIAYTTVSGLGALAVLHFVWRAPEAFFAWQAVTGLLNVLVLAWFSWRLAPPPVGEVRFARLELHSLAGFAMGNAATAILVFILTQTDRVMLSALAPLAQFGIYTLAANLNAGLAGLSTNVTSVLFPKFAQLSGGGDPAATAAFLHRSAQFTAVTMIPLCLSAIAAMDVLLPLWLRNQAIAHAAVTPARLLIAGTVFNALISVPYSLVLGRGNTRFGLVLNFFSALLLVPLLYLLITRFGIAGAAGGWFSLNLGYYLIAGYFMLRATAPEETALWYWQDTGRPLLVAGAIFGSLMAGLAWARPAPLLHLAAVAITTAGVMAGLAWHFPWMRELALRWLHQARRLHRPL